MSNVHLVVLGAGPGGYSAAFYAADQGYKVTLVDASDMLGGFAFIEVAFHQKPFFMFQG